MEIIKLSRVKALVLVAAVAAIAQIGAGTSGRESATVVIKKPDGHSRAIYFRMGRPIGTDTCQADGYPEFRATRESDLHLIRIGNECYEIPDAVVLGG